MSDIYSFNNPSGSHNNISNNSKIDIQSQNSQDSHDNNSWNNPECTICNIGGECFTVVIILVIIAIIIVGVFYWLYKYLQTHTIDSNGLLGRSLSIVPGV